MCLSSVGLEHCATNAKVTGSSPVGTTTHSGRVAQLVERRSEKPKATGSTPVSPTNYTGQSFRSLLWDSSAVEQVTVNHLVVGSIPTLTAI